MQQYADIYSLPRHSVLKFINAKQAKDLYNYTNIKRKLYRTNAAIWYNKTCRHKHLTTVEGSNGTITMTYTRGSRYSF